MHKQPLYQYLATAVVAISNCRANGNEKWEAMWEHRIRSLCRELLPSGSGFDNGTVICMEKSHGEKLVFETAFHHMNDLGMYVDWTHHVVTVKASLMSGFEVRVGGRNRNDIKDYITGAFYNALRIEVTPETIQAIDEG